MTFLQKPATSRRREGSCVGEYRLTKDADADLLKMFIYGFEVFGMSQAEEYRDGMIRCFEILAENPRLGRRADAFHPAPAAMSMHGTLFSTTNNSMAC